jgi:hypothetical protein
MGNPFKTVILKNWVEISRRKGKKIVAPKTGPSP